MRVLLLILALMMLQSCGTVGTVMEVSDLNTSGVVRKIKKARRRPEGDKKYLLEINPEEKAFMWLVTFEKFSIGDTVCVRSQSYKLTNFK